MRTNCKIIEYKSIQSTNASVVKIMVKLSDVIDIFADDQEKIFILEVDNKQYKCVFNPTQSDVIGNIVYDGQYLLICRLLVYNTENFSINKDCYFSYYNQK